MSHNLTIFQILRAQALEEMQRRADCVAAIKKIHAADPDVVVNPPRRGPRGAGNVAKLSPGGEFIGWYRENQKSGLPSRLMPIAQEMEKLFQQYKKSVIDAFPKTITASILGELSGEARKERGYYQDIIHLHQKLLCDGVLKHHRAKLIAKALSCSTEYVRRILRKLKIANQHSIKSTT